MNEEEKKAIEYLDKYTKWETYGERNLEKDIMTALNLIEKLQKENEELKADNYELNNRITDLLENIPVQKVKDKIEEIQEEGYWLFTTDRDSDKCVEVLQELIEERKVK